MFLWGTSQIEAIFKKYTSSSQADLTLVSQTGLVGDVKNDLIIPR